MIGICRICGRGYETTEEDANIPLWCAGPNNRICLTCFQKQQQNEENQK
jgi:hypothetical protein